MFHFHNTSRPDIPTNDLADDSLSVNDDLCFDTFPTNKSIFTNCFNVKEPTHTPLVMDQEIYLPVDYFLFYSYLILKYNFCHRITWDIFKKNLPLFPVNFECRNRRLLNQRGNDDLLAKEKNFSPDFEVHDDLMTITNDYLTTTVGCSARDICYIRGIFEK